MKLVKFTIFTIMILSALVNLFKAKQIKYDIEPSYNPLPREWKSNSITTHAGRIHHGTKYLAAQKALHVSNTYENTSSDFKNKLAKRHRNFKKTLKKIN